MAIYNYMTSDHLQANPVIYHFDHLPKKILKISIISLDLFPEKNLLIIPMIHPDPINRILTY